MAIKFYNAIAYLDKLMPQTKETDFVVVCLSGRGDKDVVEVARLLFLFVNSFQA